MSIGQEYRACEDGNYRKVAEFPNGAKSRDRFTTVVLVRDIAGRLIKAECGAEARRTIRTYFNNEKQSTT